jgi:UDP-N-acetylglucosamine 4-epimerase
MLNKNILITGGAGFIGSHICEQLLINGVKHIRVIDNLSTGYKNNIQPFLDKYDDIEFIEGDISNIDTCRTICKDIDIICHQAALGSVPRSIGDPLSSHNSNINGTFNMLLAAKENGIKRFVYASSSSVYGDEPHLPKREDKLGEVLSPYALNKKVGELYANVFTRCYDMECIGLRYFNVFGPRQSPNGVYAAVIPKFIELMKQGKSPIINGDGSFSRDFTYIDNVVQANILAMTLENTKCFGQVFNIGAGSRITLLELISAINKELGTDIKPVFRENRSGDIPHSNADISKAVNMLGYEVKVSFEEGIIRTLSFFHPIQTQKIKIFKFGSCRSSINSFVAPNIDIFDNYDFSHTTKEVLQYIDFMEGHKSLNKNNEMQSIMNYPESYNQKYFKKYYDEADIIYIEISSIKIIKYDNYYYSITRNNTYKNLNNIKLDTKIYIMTLEQLNNDINEIKNRINKPIIFQGHYHLFENKKNLDRNTIDTAILNSANNKLILKNFFKNPKDMLRNFNEGDYNHFSNTGYKLLAEEFNKIVNYIIN